MKKIILHLCADTGSDSRPYQNHPDYEVVLVGSKIGVENYTPPANVYGVFSNPVCTEFSAAARDNGIQKPKRARNTDDGLFLVRHCQRIIAACNPEFWVMENPATGNLKLFLGTPSLVYEPWEYGSPWTKRTALWGVFNKPQKVYSRWEDVPQQPKLYARPGRRPSLAFLHKSAAKLIPEFADFNPQNDMELRSLCSQKFAQAFFEVNR